MSRTLGRVAVVTVIAGGTALLLGAGCAPWLVAAGLLLSLVPIGRAWVAARGTALRASVAWATIAVLLGVVSQIAATAGWSMAGHWTYLTTLALLAALISVLNARTPGGGAWAILMALLVLVFLIPWLEGPGLRRVLSGEGPLRLDAPWTLFYGVLVLAGVTNYLPTRYAPAAVVLGLGFALEYVGLTSEGASPERRALLGSALPWCLAAAVWLADWRAGAPSAARFRLEDVWFRFRDHWGVVWALRIEERFNRTAGTQGWPFRLAWHGVVALPGEPEGASAHDEAAVATLIGLLRRFAEPSRLDPGAANGVGRPCEPSGLGR
jgi:hypothetical protein